MQDIELLMFGGSAGSLEPLLTMLPALPSSLAMPILVVMHLAPSHHSLLPELLGRVCDRRVREIEDKVRLEPRVIYTAPPNYHVLIEHDRILSLSVDPPVHFSRPSIDVLFESAADTIGRHAAAVLLSGANEDGAHGLVRVLDAGGVAAIQDPATAPHPEMPAAAVRMAAGRARVLPVAGLIAFCSGLRAPLHQDVRP